MEIALYRVILFVQHPDKLKTFYQDNFNCLLMEEIKNEWVVLKAGPVEIALHKIGEGYNTKEVFKPTSNAKLVFRINSDLKSFRQKLLDNGVLLKEIKSFQGINLLFCDGQDPEGNIFQLEERLSY